MPEYLLKYIDRTLPVNSDLSMATARVMVDSTVIDVQPVWKWMGAPA